MRRALCLLFLVSLTGCAIFEDFEDEFVHHEGGNGPPPLALHTPPPPGGSCQQTAAQVAASLPAQTLEPPR